MTQVVLKQGKVVVFDQNRVRVFDELLATGTGTADDPRCEDCICPCYIACGGAILPVGFQLQAAFSGNGSYTSNLSGLCGSSDCGELGGCCDPAVCELYNGPHYLLHYSRVFWVWEPLDEAAFCDYYVEYTPVQGMPVAWEQCEYLSIIPGGWSAAAEPICEIHNPEIFPDGYLYSPFALPGEPPRSILGNLFCSSTELGINISRGSSAWGLSFVISGELGSKTVVFTAQANLITSRPVFSGCGEGIMPVGRFRSDPVPIGDDLDFRSLGSISLADVTASDGLGVARDDDDVILCNRPSSITIEPMSSMEMETSGVIIGSDGCRGVNFVPCPPMYSQNGVLALDGTLNGQDFRLCMTGPSGYSDGPWEGTIVANEQGWTGTCAGKTINVSLECVDIGNYEYEYRLIFFDGTDTVYIIYHPSSPPSFGDVISGSRDLCGGTGLAFAALINDFTGYDGSHPFKRCCALDIAQECLLRDYITVTASVTFGGHSCTITPQEYSLTQGDILCGGTPITATGFNSSEAYFVGTFPLQGGTPDIARMVIYCDGTNIRYILLDSNNCILGGAGATGTVTWDCSSLSGYIQTPLSKSCAISSYTIHINGGAP